MSFFDELQNETAVDREHLMSAPLVRQSISGETTLDSYAAFLVEAYHHVKHTVPLLMNVGARLPEEKEWLRTAVAEYIEEELGHQDWILNDIAACGFDADQAKSRGPSLATELLVAYAYDVVNRIDPIGFFGMVHVLEGTSIRVADAAADGIQRGLGLPDSAFTYLRSHGALDQEHVRFFKKLMNRIEAPDDRARIIHCARVFYRLYGDVLRGVTQHARSTLGRTRIAEKGYAA